MTAVRTRVEDSRAARMPAPPAPTITTSYWWVCIGVDAFLSLGEAKRQDAVQNDGSRSAGEADGHGSNVKITSVPSTTTTVNARYSVILRARRRPSRSA